MSWQRERVGLNLYRWRGVTGSGWPREVEFFNCDPIVRRALGRWSPCPNVNVAKAIARGIAAAKRDEGRVLDIAYGRIDLEATHDFRNPLGPGVWRRSTDPDTLEADYEDGMASYTRAPELSCS